MANSNNLFVLGLNMDASKQKMETQLKQISKELSNKDVISIVGNLDMNKSQQRIQEQLNKISTNLKVNVRVDNVQVAKQTQAINKQMADSVNVKPIDIPFQFDLSDAVAVKKEINRIVSEITNNQGELTKFKIHLDDGGNATKVLLTYKNELNEVTDATLKLKEVGSWYDANGTEHKIVKWAEGQKTLSQNIEATVKANQKQIESDNQIIRKKEELIAQMKLLNTQAEKAGLSLNYENQTNFNDLSVNTSTMDDIKQLESYLRLARIEYQTFNAEISKGTHASSLESMNNNLQQIPGILSLIEARFKSIQMPETVKTQIEQLRADMESINTIQDPSLKIQKYNELVLSLQNLQREYQITAQEQKNLNSEYSVMQGASTLSNEIVVWMSNNRYAAEQYNSVLKKIIENTQTVSNKTDLTRLQQQFKAVKTQAESTNKTSQGFFGNLKMQMKDILVNMLKYQLAYKIIQETIKAIKNMINKVTELDKQLTEFNKVADLSVDQLNEFADRAYKSSEKIGRTGRDMVEAATEFKRAGYDLEQSLNLGKSALIMTNVADGINETSDAASTLISVMKGFNIAESESIRIVDKMNSVSNQSPVSFNNLADGLERVSGTMYQSGNTIDETIGLLTGGFAQLRNMEKVSTGLITISQRLRAVDEDGNAIDGLSAELEEAFNKIGVSIEDSNGELRSTYNILSDYAKVYSTLTSEQKQYFAELASGKRQVNVFNAIIQQMQDVDNAVAQSIDSVGAAEAENEIYRQSIEGMKNEFNNAFQALSKEVIDSDWIKDLISAGTDLIGVLTDIVKQDDLVSGTIGVITDGIKGISFVLKTLTENKGIASLIKGFMTLKTITKGMDIFNFVNGKMKSQKNMNAFFQSAINGTMQVKDGFLQIGEAEKQMMEGGTSNGFGRQVKSLIVVHKYAYSFKIA